MPLQAIDYPAEAEAYRTKVRRARQASRAIAVLADIRAARQRERDDPEGISSRRSTCQVATTREAYTAAQRIPGT